MKKIFALALAVAMVLSLASVAFAADEVYSIDSIEQDAHKVPKDETYVGTTKAATISYGNTIYYVLRGSTWNKQTTAPISRGDYVTKYDAVKGVKIAATWDVGSDWVSKTEFVKKRYGDGGEYIYFLAITFKSAPTRASNADVIGEIILKKTSGDNKINRTYTDPVTNDEHSAVPGAEKGETMIFNVDIELQYSKVTTAEIDDTSKKFAFGDDSSKGQTPEDEEQEFTFKEWVDATFTVNTYGQSDIVLKATTTYNADIGALYPEANLDFYIGNGASFNKTGTMFIPADEGSYIYEIVNGALQPIRGAEYDEYDEGFYFRTRTLGSYVTSDVELSVSAGPVVTPGDDSGITVIEPSDPPSITVPTNPTTGAVA